MKTSTKGVVSYSDVPQLSEQDEYSESDIIKIVTTSAKVPSSLEEVVFGSKFVSFPKDLFGWSIVKPQNDSRFIYVSSSEGDDNNARYYTTEEIVDPQQPSNKVVAFRTIASALKLQRDGYSDWILLKKGDEWQIENTLSLQSGRSISAPLVITSYGSSNKRPLIKTGIHTGIKLIKSRSFIALMGIEFYANQRDPSSNEFVGWDNVGDPIGFRSISAANKTVDSLFFEDNVFRYFSTNIILDGDSKHKNIILRRNQLLNSYSVNYHSQGMYAKSTSMLLEENLFDHNGWYQQNYGALNSRSEGQATKFNHNAYLSNLFDSVIQGNTFSRSSSIGLKLASLPNTDSQINTVEAKNIVVHNNLFLEGEVGISAGGNSDFNNGYRWKNISIIDNVMLHVGNGRPTRRDLAWHIDAYDWDGGIIKNNHLLYNDNSKVTNVFGIQVYGLSREIEVLENVVDSIGGTLDKMIYLTKDETLSKVNIKNSDITLKTVKDTDRRDLNSYFKLSTQAGNGIEKLVDNAKTLSKDSWNSNYLASEINQYLME